MKKYFYYSTALLFFLLHGAWAQPISLAQLGQQTSFYLNFDSDKLPQGVKTYGPRVPGKWGKALLCEPALQNLIANADFSQGLENWITIGAPQLQTEITDGVKSTFIQCTPGNVARQPVLQLPANDAVYCLSFYARAVGENARPLAAVRIGGRNISLDENQAWPLGNSWERRWLVFTCDTAPILSAHDDAATRATSATITLGAAAGTVQIGRVQLESGGFPTSFTASQRGNSMISLTGLAGRLNPAQGTIAMWIFPDWTPGDYGGSTFFHWPADGTKPSWRYDLLNFAHSYQGAWGAGFLVFAGDDAGNLIYPLAPDPAWQRHTWHHIAFTWKLVADQTSHICIYLDGQLAKDAESEKKLGARISGDSIMFGGGDGRYANAALDEISVFPKVLSAEEIKILAQATTPMKPVE